MEMKQKRSKFSLFLFCYFLVVDDASQERTCILFFLPPCTCNHIIMSTNYCIRVFLSRIAVHLKSLS